MSRHDTQWRQIFRPARTSQSVGTAVVPFPLLSSLWSALWLGHALAQIIWAGPALPCWPYEVEGQGQGQGQPIESAPVPPTGALRRLRPEPAALPASLPLFHEARYDIRYGILGSVGTLTFNVGGVVEAADGSRLVRVEGAGAGAVLGLGGIERKIEAEFDPISLQSRRWSILRLRNGQEENQGIRDTVVRDDGGALLLERSNPGQVPARQTVTFAVPTSDPLGLLWRLRTAPPTPGRNEVLYLLDGLALWRVSVTTAGAKEILPEGNRTAIRIDGDLAPIFFDGLPDGGRPSRRFTLWLSDATDHLPLRLEVPVGLADVVMTLTDARRTSGQLTGPVPGARNL